MVAQEANASCRSHRRGFLIDAGRNRATVGERGRPTVDVSLKLFTSVSGRDNDLLDTRLHHGVFDKINDGTTQHFHHWFGPGGGQRHQPAALATGHDDAQHQTTSASANGTHAAHVFLLRGCATALGFLGVVLSANTAKDQLTV